MLTFTEWLNEGSRWRDDKALADLANLPPHQRMTRLQALAKAYEKMGIDPATKFSGWKKWLGNMDFDEPDERSADDIMAGKQPEFLYRGSQDYDTLVGGGYHHRSTGTMHASPYSGDASFYTRYAQPSNHGDTATGMSLGDDNYSLLAKYYPKSGQRYTKDNGIEDDEPQRTPAEIKRFANGNKDQVKRWSHETDASGNEYVNKAIARNLGRQVADLDDVGEKVWDSAARRLKK